MNVLRQVRIAGHSLTIRDSGRVDRLGKTILQCRLKHGRQVIFEGANFACSPIHAIDSDEAIKSLLGFLTLQSGDTDEEYFESYSPKQIAWRDEHAESLAMAVGDRFGFDD